MKNPFNKKTADKKNQELPPTLPAPSAAEPEVKAPHYDKNGCYVYPIHPSLKKAVRG